LRVFENRMLRRYLYLRGTEAGEDCAVRSFYASANIVLVIKSRRMRWVGTCSMDRDEKHTQNFGQKT
jgi:hypothetical protein